MSIKKMMGAPYLTAGQQVFTNAGTTTVDTTFVVPAGVTEICAVCVGGGSILRGATDLMASPGGFFSGGAPSTNGNPGGNGGGGGAAGYSGNGGTGGGYATVNTGIYGGAPGLAGSGGGGGGGGGGNGTLNAVNAFPGNGGGVGLVGQGTNGAGGAAQNSGGSGSQLTGSGSYGRGADGQPGASLKWKNAISVTPGESLTVRVPRRGADGVNPVNNLGGTSATRIMWGGGRSYPSNALDWT